MRGVAILSGLAPLSLSTEEEEEAAQLLITETQNTSEETQSSNKRFLFILEMNVVRQQTVCYDIVLLKVSRAFEINSQLISNQASIYFIKVLYQMGLLIVVERLEDETGKSSFFQIQSKMD